MKWYKFRDTEEFKNADIIHTVNENGEEVEISSDKLQRMEVVDVKRIGYPEMFPRELEVTIR